LKYFCHLMIKALIRFLLSLCFLLLIGYGHVHAHIRQSSIYYSPVKIRKGFVYTNVCTLQNRHTFISASSSSPKKKSFKINAPDIERKEDDLITSEKYLEISNYFTTIFYVQPTAGYFFHNRKNSLAFFKDFSYCSLHRSLYLILQVARI
jgi:hypothetical protein